MFLALAAGGFVRATQFTSSNALSFVEVDQRRITAASTLSAVVLQLAIAMGITVGGLTLQLARMGHAGAITPDQFVLPFAVVGLMSLLATPVYLALVARHRLGHDRPPASADMRH